MQTASLPRNFSASKANTTQTYSFEWPRLGGSGKLYSKAVDADSQATLNLQVDENEAKSKTDVDEEARNDVNSASSAASFFFRYDFSTSYFNTFFIYGIP